MATTESAIDSNGGGQTAYMIDFETGGLCAATDAVTQIGVVKFDLDTLQSLSLHCWDIRVSPDSPLRVTPEALAVLRGVRAALVRQRATDEAT
jgi:hypothetical protein